MTTKRKCTKMNNVPYTVDGHVIFKEEPCGTEIDGNQEYCFWHSSEPGLWNRATNSAPNTISHSVPQAKCAKGDCYVGTVSSVHMGFFNDNDVFLPESRFVAMIKEHQRQGEVWIFNFCPKCGTQINRQKIAEKLGINLDDDK
jgi:hypothetical protein